MTWREINVRVALALGSRRFAVTDENPAAVWTMTLPATLKDVV